MIEQKESESETKDDNKKARKELDTWMKDQDEKVQTMITDATAGLRSALQKERENAKAAAKLEKELADAKKKLDAYKTDEERELEEGEQEVAKLTTERDEAKVASDKAVAGLEKARIGFAITTEALKQGLSDPEDAKALLGNIEDITWNKETNKVEGAEEAIKKLIKDKPYLVAGAELGTPRKDSKKKGDKKPDPPTGIRF